MPYTPIFDSTLEKRIRGYIRARVPTQDADDIIQNAWLRIIQNKEKYDPKRGSVRTWATFQCKSAIADYYRRRQPDQHYEVHGPRVEPEPSPADYERLLEVTFTTPSDLHRLIIFGYIQLLEWKPAEIVAKLTNQALKDLGNRFVVDYSSNFPHHRSTILNLLHPFTERLRGARTPLIDFFSEPTNQKEELRRSQPLENQRPTPNPLRLPLPEIPGRPSHKPAPTPSANRLRPHRAAPLES